MSKRIVAMLDENLVFIWQDLLNQKSRIFAVHTLLRVLGGTLMLVAIPYAIGFFINGLTTRSLDALLVGAVLFLSFELSGVMLGWWRQQTREYFFQEAFWNIPQAITRLYFKRPLSWLSSSTSEIDGGGVDSLKDKVWSVTNGYIFQIIPGWSMILFSLAACTYANVWLGLLVLIYIVIERYIGTGVNQYIHTRMRPVIDSYKRWDRRMHEWWRSVDHVKSQGVETKVLYHIAKDVQDALKEDDAIWRVYFAKTITQHRLRSILFAMALYALLGSLVFTNTVSLAVAVLVFFSCERVRVTLIDLNDQQRDIQYNIAGIAKYRRVLMEEVPFAYNEGIAFTANSIAVTFDNVSHSVADGKERKLVLRDVSLDIAVGEKVGVVGPSGAGKSQLLSLLVRATDPEKGRVLISGTDMRKLRLESLLRYYGVIMQKSEPFEDTVLGNLLFGVSHMDMPTPFASLSDTAKEVLIIQAHEALQKAGLGAENFSEGIFTTIGYKGLKLSGGQQQRLQIAAAHMKLSMSKERPRLIIADEPTSSLDSLSELTVMEHLQDNLPEGTTMFMVAHRLSTVAHMDKIVFVRPLSACDENTPQVTVHATLAELYQAEALFREMADAQGFRPQGLSEDFVAQALKATKPTVRIVK